MRLFSKAAAASAAAGLAVFGAVASGGGVAHAATGQSVTGCSVSSGVLVPGAVPACTAVDSTVVSPTSFTITANPSIFNVLGGLPNINTVLSLLGETLGVRVTYTLNCSVNGATVSHNGSFTATSGAQSQTVNLQSAVGSPSPGKCTVHNLQATSLVSLSSTLLGLLGANTFTVGASATANTAVPGAVWKVGAKTSGGVNADICMDDAANGNSGAHVQVYQCNSDLAQYWVQSSTGRLVHNGDCVTQAGGKVVLERCTSGDTAQQWAVNGTGGNFNTVVNQSSGDCLTAPSAKNFTQLTAVACNGSASQKWTGPAKSPA